MTTTTCVTCPSYSVDTWGRRRCCSPQTARASRTSSVAPYRVFMPLWTLVQVTALHSNPLFNLYVDSSLSYSQRIRALVHHMTSRCELRESWPVCLFSQGGNVSAAFVAQRHVEPRGPLVNISHCYFTSFIIAWGNVQPDSSPVLQVNSEFYAGWLDHWGSHHSTVSTAVLAKSLNEILALRANVNL